MKLILVPILSLAALALAGFTLTSASTPVAVTTPAESAVTYTIDAVHSTVMFSTMHLNTSRSYGRFNEFSGTFTIDTAKPEASKVDIQIQAASIDTNHEGRDDHLRGPDFFDVKQFPLATFQSHSVKKTDKKWAVTGTLALHGVKKDVTIALEETGQGKGRQGEALIGFHGTFSITRADFGMEYGKGMLGDTVDVIISIEAAAAK